VPVRLLAPTATGVVEAVGVLGVETVGEALCDAVPVSELAGALHSYTTAKRLCVPPHGSPRRASGCSVQADRPTHSDLA
jgi:hypothetical protein